MSTIATKVAIVSSNTFVRLGLRRTFETHPGVHVVGECPWGPSAHDLVERERPDLIVVDLELDMNQVDVISLLRQWAPRSRIVLLTGWADMERGRQAMEVGADVIMMKCQPASILLAIVDSVAKRHGAARPQAHSLPPPERDGANPEGMAALHPKTEALTTRERAVVALVGQGLSNRDIAERLCISETTVRHHLTSIFDKLGVSNRQKLLILAYQRGLTEGKSA